MTVQEFFLLLGFIADPEPMNVGWFERFGFAAGLLVAVLLGIYRLARLAIIKVGDEVAEWFKEQAALFRALRLAVPHAKAGMSERNATLDTMATSLGELGEGQSRLLDMTEEALAGGETNKGEQA